MANYKKVSTKSSDDEIIAALLKKKIKAPESWGRDNLINAAEQAGIWVQVKASLVPDSYKERYGPSQNCGDEFAGLMAGNDVKDIAADNGINLKRWKGKNPGMVRMNLGNVLRGRVKRGEYVVIDGHEFNPEAKAA